MPALVTLPPIEVDPVTFARASADETTAYGSQSIYFGPFLFGGALYIIFEYSAFAPVYKSTDNGATWVRQDAAGFPSPGSSGTTLTSQFDAAAGIIYFTWAVAGLPAPHFLVIGTFNCNTDTYGALSTGSPDSVVSASPLEMILQPGGDIYIIYSPSSGTGLKWMKYSGGAWSGPTLLVATASIYRAVVSSIVNPADSTMHVFYIDWTANPGNGTLYYIPLDASGTPGVKVFLLAVGTGVRPRLNSGKSVIWHNQIIFPLIDPVVPWTMRVFRGTPVSAPVWTEEDVDPGAVAPQPPDDGFSGAFFPNLYVDDQTGNLVAIWNVVDFSPPSFGDIDQLWMAIDSGSGWGTPFLFYDYLTNAPPDGDAPFFQFIHTSGFIDLPSGIVYVTALETTDGGISHCTGFVLLVPATPPPPVTRRAFPQYIRPRNSRGHG